MLALRRLVTTVALALAVSLAARAETFVNRKTGEEVTGKLYGAVVKDGKYMYFVKGEDKKGRYLDQEEWDKKGSPARPQGEPDKAPEKKGTTGEPARKGSVVSVDFGEGDRPGPGGERLIQLKATGAGETPDKAVQAAFCRAIEQAVGVLVDSETRVRNDQLVKDEILTYSRGFVQKYSILKTWKEDGVDKAQIEALVAVDKLAEKLRAGKVAVREVPGELLYRQAKQEVASEENATRMLEKALADCRMDKLVQVEIGDKPEIVQRDARVARVKVTARLVPDLKQWERAAGNLRPLLTRIAAKRAIVACKADFSTGEHAYGWERRWSTPASFRMFPAHRSSAPPQAELEARLAGKGILVCLFVDLSRKGDASHWEVFRVPEALRDVLDAAREPKYRLTFSFLDAQDKEILRVAETELLGGAEGYPSFPRILTVRGVSAYGEQGYYLGPIFWTSNDTGSFYAASAQNTRMVDLDLEQLRQVAKVAASLEEVRK